MEASLLKTVGQVAGIGGLALGVFLLLFRDVIRRNIFPSLSKEHAYKIIRLFLLLTFALAFGGIAAWVYTTVASRSVHQAAPSDSKVAFVDLGLGQSTGENTEFPTLDVKLRNRGDTAAFLKRAEVTVLDRIEFTDCADYYAEPTSWTYQMNLENPAPFPLSQSVPAKGVDRFSILLGHELNGANEHAFYRLRLTLIYDEDDKRLTSSDFAIYLPGMAVRMASTTRRNQECFDALARKLRPARSWPVTYSFPDYFNES